MYHWLCRKSLKAWSIPSPLPANKEAGDYLMQEVQEKTQSASLCRNVSAIKY